MIKVANLNQTQTIEVSIESCYQNKIGTFCVLRSFNKSQNVMLYLGCVIPDNQNEFIQMVVDRAESPNGDVMQRDDWSKNRLLEKGKIPSVSNAIIRIRKEAAFNDYSSVPPYAFILMMSLGS